MSLHIIIGEAGSGKSNILAADLAERSLVLAGESFFAIVPEQATLKMQQRVVRQHARHATFNIDVVSFDRLAHVVFSDLGIEAADVLDDTGKVLILRQVLEECREDLLLYKSKVHMPGFVERIKSAVTELKQYGIDDNALYLMQESAQAKNNPLLYTKLQDLRLILHHFNERIRGVYRASEEVLDLFAQRVPDSERIRNSHIYLDGFTGFTPVQLRLITQFLKYAADVTATITIPPEKTGRELPVYDLFHLSSQTLTKLQKAAEEAGCDVELIQAGTAAPSVGAEKSEPAGVNSDEPASGEPESAQHEKQCAVYAARDLNDEVTFAAKEILRLVRDENLRYREIAVIVSDMEAYHRQVETVFREAGIPFFIDHKSGITENPLSRYLLAALRLADQRFSADSVFSYLKTGLTDLSLDDISKLENYCLEFGLRGVRTFRSEMTKNRKLHGPEPSAEALKSDPYAGMAWNLDEINKIRTSVIESIESFWKEISRSGLCAEDYGKALKKLLKKNRISEKLDQRAKQLEAEGKLKDQREYEQVYALAEELLEKTMILSGTKPLTVKEYCDMIESGLSEIRVGIIPPTLDTLTVGDLTRTRLDDVRILFLLGANNGRIPAAAEPAGVLSAKDREFLKNENFEMAPTASDSVCIQRFYLYLMFRKPSQLLYITYACTDGKGEALEPSYILEDITLLVPGIHLREITEIPDIKWEKQAMKELSVTIRKEPDEVLLQYFAKAHPFQIRQITEGAFYTNAQTALDPQVAADLYGGVLSGSVSRYEKFSECPFKHFLNYGIRLEKRPEYEIAAADVGTIYHSSLELYSRALEASGYSFRTVPDEVSVQLAKESVGKALEEMQSDILDSTARNGYFVKRITEVTVKTTNVLRQHVRAGMFEPDAFELEFREDISDSVRFKGKIDRVDIYDAGDVFVKIIDYKSGQKQFKISDIYSGLQLQLVVYLKEAISAYEKKYPDRSVKAGGVYYYHINDRFVHTEEEAEKRFQMSGVTSCEADVVQAVDGGLAPDRSRSSTIINVSYKGEDEFTKKSDIANDAELRHMMDFAEKKIEEISSSIRSGDIRIEPYWQQERKNACTFCDYKDVCKFEPGSFGTDWKEKQELSDEELEAEVYGRISSK